MVGGAFAVHKEETTGFSGWYGTNYVSFFPEQRKIRRHTDIQHEHLSVSNEFSSLKNIHTESFRNGAVQEEAFQGLVENISHEGDALSDLQKNIDAAEKKTIVPENVRLYRRNKKLKEEVEYLNKFADSLGTAVAPMYINIVKKALADSWQSIEKEDSEIRITIASLEGALRQKKWRDYDSEQVKAISQILTDCIKGRLRDINSALERLSILRKKDIDIYPSASEDDYVEKET